MSTVGNGLEAASPEPDGNASDFLQTAAAAADPQAAFTMAWNRRSRCAEYADMDRTFVSLLERGLRQPSLDNLFRLARALGVAPATLVSRTAALLG
jgi:hypothetical protein